MFSAVGIAIARALSQFYAVCVFGRRQQYLSISECALWCYRFSIIVAFVKAMISIFTKAAIPDIMLENV